MSAAAQAIPPAELMLAAQDVQQTARRVQHQVLLGRRMSPLESMHLTAMLRSIAHDMRQSRELLRLTRAANDELAAPVQA